MNCYKSQHIEIGPFAEPMMYIEVATYNAYNISYPHAIPKSWKSLTIAELYAFFDTLIMIGANHSNLESVRDLWNVKSYSLQ